MMPKLGNNLMGILKSRCTCDFIKGGSRQAHLGSTPQFLFIDTQQTHHKMGKSTKGPSWPTQLVDYQMCLLHPLEEDEYQKYELGDWITLAIDDTSFENDINDFMIPYPLPPLAVMILLPIVAIQNNDSHVWIL